MQFHESQRMAPWVYLLVVPPALLLIWMAFVQIGLGIPVGDRPMPNAGLAVMVVLVSILLPAFMFALRLEIDVAYEGVRVRFRPMMHRLIQFDQIESAVAKTYRPMAEYGGWGIRGWGRRVAYNARGSSGVLVTLKDGATIMLGTQRASELEAAIRSGLS